MLRGGGDEGGLGLAGLHDEEIRGHVLDGEGEGFFELKVDHAGEFGAIRGGEGHALQEHGLAGEGEVQVGARGQGGGGLGERGKFLRRHPGAEQPPGDGIGREKRGGRAGFLHSFQERI